MIVAPHSCIVAWDQATYNFGEVQPAGSIGRARCRLGPRPERFATHRIKTVLNLRGSNSVEAWYRDEVAATNLNGATQIDIAMSSCIWMSRAQLRAWSRRSKRPSTRS